MNYCSKNQAIKCNFQSIDLAITDARSNLLDSLRFASHDRAHGISIVFGGKVIAGTDGRILDTLAGSYDGLIIESFSVGVLPNYGNDSFLNALSDWTGEVSNRTRRTGPSAAASFASSAVK